MNKHNFISYYLTTQIELMYQEKENIQSIAHYSEVFTTSVIKIKLSSTTYILCVCVDRKISVISLVS